MASPVPQPRRLRVLKGNGVDRRADGKKVPHQPQVVPHLPDAPDHLPDLAAEMWGRVCGELRRMEIAGMVDVAALEAFCMAYQTMRDADAQVAEDGIVSTGSMGQPVAHPLLAVAAKARSQIGTLGGQLGLTPAGRLRMALPEATDDETDAVFGRATAR